MSGWTGKLLRVNLTEGTHAVEDIPEAWRRVDGKSVVAAVAFIFLQKGLRVGLLGRCKGRRGGGVGGQPQESTGNQDSRDAHVLAQLWGTTAISVGGQTLGSLAICRQR